MSETRERMIRMIGAWKSSGRTASSFAADHGVTRAKFEYWKRQLKGAPGSRETLRAPSFVPVQVIGPGAAPLEVVLANGDRLLIPEGLSIETVRAVLGALRERC